MIPAPAPLAPLIIILIVLCAAFGWAAAKSGIDAARGKLAGELVLWTFTPAEGPPPVSGNTAGDTDAAATDTGLRRLEIPWKALGFTVAGVSGALAVLCGTVLMGPVSNYQHSYERTVWSALNDSYGIHAAIPDQGFQSGISFPALLAGKTVECAATPPSMVVCDGAAIEPKK